MMPPTRITYSTRKQAIVLNTPRLETANAHEMTIARVTSPATVLCLGWSSERPPHLPQRYGARRVMESKRSGFAKALQCGQMFMMPNGEHEPREAAAAGSRTWRDRTGCLPLAQC